MLEGLSEGTVDGMIESGIVFLVCVDDTATGDMRVGQGGVCIFTFSVNMLNAVVQWLLSSDETLGWSTDVVW